MRAISKFFVWPFFAFLAACTGASTQEGGTGVGNPSTPRMVTGRLEASESGFPACEGIAAVAIDPSGGRRVDALDSSCDFRFDLEPGKAYRIAFEDGTGAILAVVRFENGSGNLPSPFFVFGEGDALSLGIVRVIEEGVAVPDYQPAFQNDWDGDGLNDYEDTDDDGDGVPDLEEGDCDLDGLADDYDDPGDCEGNEGSMSTARVLEVVPRNGDGLEEGTGPVPLTTLIFVRVSCHLDPASVSPDSFRVSSGTSTVSCDFAFPSAANSVECRPSSPLEPESIHGVILDGLRCQNGREIEAAAFSWKTAAGALN